MYTVGPEIWRENSKMWKMSSTHSRTLNMSTKMTNDENEKTMVGPGKLRETCKNVQNETQTLLDLENREKQ